MWRAPKTETMRHTVCPDGSGAAIVSEQSENTCICRGALFRSCSNLDVTHTRTGRTPNKQWSQRQVRQMGHKQGDCFAKVRTRIVSGSRTPQRLTWYRENGDMTAWQTMPQSTAPVQAHGDNVEDNALTCSVNALHKPRSTTASGESWSTLVQSGRCGDRVISLTTRSK